MSAFAWPDRGEEAGGTHDFAAIAAAISLADRPASVRLAKSAPLPAGISLLIAVAARDEQSITAASRQTGRTPRDLQKAASFFIEQVLFADDTDSYRILGVSVNAGSEEIRRNMAMLMRWLHPDVRHGGAAPQVDGAAEQGFDRSIYAALVSRAWDNLKTSDRRSKYDATHVRPTAHRSRGTSPHAGASHADHMSRTPHPAARSRRPPVLSPIPRPATAPLLGADARLKSATGFWQRMLYRLAGLLGRP